VVGHYYYNSRRHRNNFAAVVSGARFTHTHTSHAAPGASVTCACCRKCAFISIVTAELGKYLDDTITTREGRATTSHKGARSIIIWTSAKMRVEKSRRIVPPVEFNRHGQRTYVARRAPRGQRRRPLPPPAANGFQEFPVCIMTISRPSPWPIVRSVSH